MLRGTGQFLAKFKVPSGARAVSSDEVTIQTSSEWYRSNPTFGQQLLGNVGIEQWEGRGLDATPVTLLCITSAGLHTSNDPHPHFTARAFDKEGNAVWFLDKKHNYYTNAIHFYQDGLPPDLDRNRFEATPSNDVNLIAWCTGHKWDIKTGTRS